MCVDSLHTGDYKKGFIRDATEWVVQYTPPAASITSNEKYIAYFSRRQFDWTAATRQNYNLKDLLAAEDDWRNSDYMVVFIKPREQAMWELFLEHYMLKETITFDSDDRGKVSVVKIQQQR